MSWLSKAWGSTAEIGRALFSPMKSRYAGDTTLLGRGVFSNSTIGGVANLAKYGAGRIAVGAAAGGIIGAATADSNNMGGVMRGAAGGALLGAGAGLLTTRGFWSLAHDNFGRPLIGMGRGALNRWAGNPIGAFRSKSNWASGLGAGAAAMGRKAGRSLRTNYQRSAKMRERALGFVTRHPNLAAGGAVLGTLAVSYNSVATGETEPLTQSQHIVAAAAPAYFQDEGSQANKEHYRMLQSSTEGLVQGLHQGRHQ